MPVAVRVRLSVVCAGAALLLCLADPWFMGATALQRTVRFTLTTAALFVVAAEVRARVGAPPMKPGH